MKRSIDSDGGLLTGKMKKIKPEEEAERSAVVLMDENLLYEVLKHVDARTLAMAACVSKRWHATARDERLWELICTRHCSNIGCATHQLRSVVLALGGFRRLHSLYLWPLFKPSSSSSSSPPSSSAWPCLSPPPGLVPAQPAASGAKTRWGKDEVHLSLSLLSIRYYERMNFNNRGKGL
ncbi:F-box protein GID2 [Diospyros lotus]|uniref:F-box protein GID2 n=1 Tax=Diospyros lotus TaxID=55363 RepID=UPI00224FFD37|nr:F-box protein GID2 [Diospyros lotus]